MPRPSKNDLNPALIMRRTPETEPVMVDAAGKVDRNGLPHGWSKFPDRVKQFLVMRPLAQTDVEVLIELGYSQGSLKAVVDKWRKDRRIRVAIKLAKGGYRIPHAALSRELRELSQEDLIPMLVEPGHEPSHYVDVIKTLFQTKTMHYHKDRVGSMALARLLVIRDSPEFRSDAKLRMDIAKLLERLSALLEPDRDQEERERQAIERNQITYEQVRPFRPAETSQGCTATDC